MLTIRSARWPQDVAALSILDTAFVTERIYRPVQEDLGLRLVEEAVQPPLHKRYAFSPSDLEEWRDWDYTAVVEENGVLAGFAAAQYVAWNRRVVIGHLYVAPDFRRNGAGTGLLEVLDVFARSVHARCLWLETQNVNHPAIQFYRRSGFAFCGFDATLYDPDAMELETSLQDEVALFFARPVFGGENQCPLLCAR